MVVSTFAKFLDEIFSEFKGESCLKFNGCIVRWRKSCQDFCNLALLVNKHDDHHCTNSLRCFSQHPCIQKCFLHLTQNIIPSNQIPRKFENDIRIRDGFLCSTSAHPAVCDVALQLANIDLQDWDVPQRGNVFASLQRQILEETPGSQHCRESDLGERKRIHRL